VLTVTCSSAVWAHELDLMGPELTGAINAALGIEALRALRCSSAPAKRWS
jgi:predicted nucleic acid-binding Zn ribbon protein